MIGSNLVHQQIASTWGTSKGAPYQSKQIPASVVPNILTMLKLYYHPVQKAIRTNKLIGITSEDYDHYINALKNEGLKRLTLNEYSLDYLLETTLHTELYKEIAKVKKELDEYLVSDLIQLREMNDPVRRLLYVRWYGAFMMRSVGKWRSAVKATQDFQNKVLDAFVEEISNKEYELVENSVSDEEEIIKTISPELEREIKQKFHRDQYNTGYKPKEDFLNEDYRTIMRTVTEEIARKRDQLNQLESYIDSIMKED